MFNIIILTIMKKIILSLVFICICCGSVFAQYDTIPSSEIPAKIQEIKNGTLKDSVFWSCVGLIDVMEYNIFSSYNYKIYVSNQGIYFELGFRDKARNISVSGIYFMPHFRKEIPEEASEEFIWVPNEHFCRCTANVGFAIVQKLPNSFTCIGAIPEYDLDDNLDIVCQDTERRQTFFRKYYEKGLNREQKINFIEPEVLPF